MTLKAASLEKLWEKVAILSLATALKGNRCLYRTRLWYDTAGSWDDVIWIVDMQDWGVIVLLTKISLVRQFLLSKLECTRITSQHD